MNEAEQRGKVRESFQIKDWKKRIGIAPIFPLILVLAWVSFELLRISSQSELLKYNKIGLLVYGVPWLHSAAPWLFLKD